MATPLTHFNASADAYDALRSGHLADRRCDEAQRFLAARAPLVRNVLEIGCGTGALLASLARRFPSLRFVGADVEPKMVDYARRRSAPPNVTYELWNAGPPRPAERYEAVVTVDVLHHVHDQHRFFRDVRGLIAPGGSWLVMEPNIYHPYIYYSQERMRRAGFDEDHFRPWATEPLLIQSGFVVTNRRYAFLFPGWVKRVPPALANIERRLEGVRLFGGSVIYELTAGRLMPSR